jgi:hypothetical protein
MTLISEMARLWIKGDATQVDTKEVKTANDAGKRISILRKGNAAQLRKQQQWIIYWFD